MSKKPGYIAAVDTEYAPPSRDPSGLDRVFVDTPDELEGDEIASSFWQNAVQARALMGLINASDYPLMVLMAQCWSDLQEARKESLKGEGRVVTSGSGHPMRSPWSSIEKDARTQFSAYEKELTKREVSRGTGKSTDSLDG